MMRTWTLLALAAAAALPASANAVVCYTLLDQGDKTLFQAPAPPVDMSDQGAAAREALRRRHEYLIITDTETCPPVATVASANGYRPATVDEIVADMRGYLTYGGVSSQPGSTRSGSVGGGGVGPGAAGPAASAGSSGMRGY